MDDNLLQLSFAIHHTKGVYALLLGSGLSRASGIPTGWEITLQLIKELAATLNLEIVDAPEDWYRQHFGEEADYDRLMERLGGAKIDRNRLIKRFFEPNEEELEDGLKQPSAAHKAIAWLVKRGYIRVIITTNFDQLLENALREVGVVPDIVKSESDFDEMTPLQHSEITVIKLHGDYRDLNIKNTKDELAQYSDIVNQLQRRIFNEYGLVICGWSGEYDVALRKALLDSDGLSNPKFGTYWTAYKGKTNDPMEQIIDHRAGRIISISDADTFFADLKDNIDSLEKLSSSKDISVSVLKQRVIKLLTANNHIELEDIVRREVNLAYQHFTSHEFQERRSAIQTGTGDSVEQEKLIWKLYFNSVERVLTIFATLGWHGSGEIFELAKMGIERLTETPTDSHQKSLVYRFIPAVQVFYAVGIPLVEKSKWEELSYVISSPQIADMYSSDGYSKAKYKPTIEFLVRYIFLETYQQRTNIFKNIKTSITETMILPQLQQIVSDYIPQKHVFERHLDLFEMLLGLMYISLDKTRAKSGVRTFDHAVLYGRSKDYLLQFWSRIGATSSFRSANLLGNTDAKVVITLADYQDFMKQVAPWFEDEFPDFADKFESAIT